MKKTKVCPKCNSSQVVRFDGFRGGYGAGNYLVTSAFSAVNVNRYVCCNCGYTEEWIDIEDLEEVINSKKAIKE